MKISLFWESACLFLSAVLFPDIQIEQLLTEIQIELVVPVFSGMAQKPDGIMNGSAGNGLCHSFYRLDIFCGEMG